MNYEDQCARINANYSIIMGAEGTGTDAPTNRSHLPPTNVKYIEIR